MHVLFSSPPPACIWNNICFMSWPGFALTPPRLHLFIIVLLIKLRMEVDVCWRIGSYDSHSWNPGQGIFHGHFCHIWHVCCHDSSEVPLWTRSGDSVQSVFPWRDTFRQTRNRRRFLRVLLSKAKQKTWLVCCCWSTTVFMPWRTYKGCSVFGKAFRNCPEVFPSKRLQCRWGGKARRMEREHLSTDLEHV